MWDLQEMTPVGISCYHVEMFNIMKGGEDDEDYVRLVPSVQGKAKVSIGAIPDVIGYIDVEEDEEDGDEDGMLYFAQWKPTGETVTGNRFKNIPAKMATDGGMKRVYEFIGTPPTKNKKAK